MNTTDDPQGFVKKGHRYYCGDGDCMWRSPLVAKEDYPHHIDCTDMTDEEFYEFLLAGGDKVTTV